MLVMSVAVFYLGIVIYCLSNVCCFVCELYAIVFAYIIHPILMHGGTLIIRAHPVLNQIRATSARPPVCAFYENWLPREDKL